MSGRSFALVLIVLGALPCSAQTIPAERTTAWSHAGFLFEPPQPTLEVTITSFGAVPDGTVPVNAAWNAAVNAVAGQMAVINFPAGEYLFTTGIIVPDSVIIRGEGSGSTVLRFDLGGSGHCIGFVGQELPDQYAFAVEAARGSSMVIPAVPFPFQGSDLLRLYRPDADLVVSPWALGTTGQMVHVEQVGDASIVLASPLRANYPAGSSYLRKIDPCWYSGIECLKVVREDATVEQWSNIWLNKASHCWVKGVESEMANFSHIEVYESTNCEITGNHLHHAFGYGSGGKAYGVNMTNTSGEVLVQDNIFEHLRHGMMVQIGANGNVFGYNYSVDPFWQQPPFPSNAAGDIVLHGDHPYLNLFEGNIVQNIVIDDSHGKNGPFNTLFRNRAEGFGLVMNNSPATDSMNIVGNEIDGTYFLQYGSGHFLYGNFYQGDTLPAGTGQLIDTTYYLTEWPAFLAPIGSLPQIGPQAGAPGTIPAKIRFESGGPFTICTDDDIITSIPATDRSIRIYPNPFTDRLVIEGVDMQRVRVIDLMGREIMEQRPIGNTVWIGNIRPATYLLEVADRKGRRWRWLVVKE